MNRTLMGALVAGAVTVLPHNAFAQGEPGPGRFPGFGPPGAPGAPGSRGTHSVTAIINARRALDLSGRQLVQLDSIERVIYTRRRAMGERMRGERDSAFARGDRPNFSRMNRDSAQKRMESMRPMFAEMRRADSSAYAAAERVLTDAQRQKVRELEIERRGEMRGRMAAMFDQHGRGAGAGRGFGPGQLGRRYMRGTPGGRFGPPRGGMDEDDDLDLDGDWPPASPDSTVR